MSSKRKIILEFLAELEKRKIRYAIMRNYEFLTNNKEYTNHDLDILIDLDCLQEVNDILRAIGNSAKAMVSLHLDSVRELGVPYMGEEVYNRAVRRSRILTFSDEDTFVNIVTHAVIVKDFIKKSYRNRIITYLEDKNLDRYYISNYFNRLFGDIHAKSIMHYLDNKDFDGLLNMRRKLIFKFVTRDTKSLILYLPYFLRNILRNIFAHFINLRKGRLIALVGVDGSGKSTASEIMKDFFEEQLGQKCTVVYMGRSKNRVLPGVRATMGRFGINLPEPARIKSENHFKKKLFYIGRDITYILDSFARYIFFVHFKIIKRINVVTDRYAYDIILNEATFALTKWVIINLYPKPNLLIYLYNSPGLLFERKKEYGIRKLSENMEILESVVNELEKRKLKIAKIKTDNIASTSQIIFENIE